jgi:hypothetical protein
MGKRRVGTEKLHSSHAAWASADPYFVLGKGSVSVMR